jgi:hypothetical protein
VQCGYCVKDGTTYKSCGGTTINPGQTVGGELGGIWACGVSSTATYVYKCAAAADPYTCVKVP